MTAIRVDIERAIAGDRLSVYTGPDEDHLTLSGILWCDRAAALMIVRLLDPDGSAKATSQAGGERHGE